jgi:hypothetical protein
MLHFEDHLEAAQRHMAIANGELQPTSGTAVAHAQAEALIAIAQQLTHITAMLNGLIDAQQVSLLQRELDTSA